MDGRAGGRNDAARRPDDHLRGPPRELAARSDDPGRLLGYREIAAAADRARPRRRVHPRRVPAGHGAPVLRRLGLPDHRVLRPHCRYGTPQDFMGLVDQLHRAGIGVILDWVPVALPRRRLRPRPLRRHPPLRTRRPPARGPPRLGQPGLQLRPPRGPELPPRRPTTGCRRTTPTGCASTRWPPCSTSTTRAGPASGSPTVRAGARTSMRSPSSAHSTPGSTPTTPTSQVIAEESTAWPGVSRPVEPAVSASGSSGTWAGCTTRSTTWPTTRSTGATTTVSSPSAACTPPPRFVLPLSHDEVVHGKGSLLAKMPGTTGSSSPTAPALGYQYALPGKKLLFMGSEFAELARMGPRSCLDWDLLADPSHAGCVPAGDRDLNISTGPSQPSTNSTREPGGFDWVLDDEPSSVLAFLRRAATRRPLLVVCNFTPVPRHDVLSGCPTADSGASCSTATPSTAAVGWETSAGVEAHPSLARIPRTLNAHGPAARLRLLAPGPGVSGSTADRASSDAARRHLRHGAPGAPLGAVPVGRRVQLRRSGPPSAAR